ncbi:hypothetical protein [Aestuariivivens sediminis]|uniref:hypothetical protein n=1 Tax=Aestuariivivens sediminis TaxID=2913557 RepID=UPI001F567D95|nr:hypothetical protein [Aestuariivivens sediminis]
MNKAQDITKKIARITQTIEENYPELYRILEEEPFDDNLGAPTKIKDVDLEAYLIRLEELLKNHIKNLDSD